MLYRCSQPLLPLFQFLPLAVSFPSRPVNSCRVELKRRRRRSHELSQPRGFMFFLISFPVMRKDGEVSFITLFATWSPTTAWKRGVALKRGGSEEEEHLNEVDMDQKTHLQSHRVLLRFEGDVSSGPCHWWQTSSLIPPISFSPSDPATARIPSVLTSCVDSGSRRSCRQLDLHRGPRDLHRVSAPTRSRWAERMECGIAWHGRVGGLNRMW